MTATLAPALACCNGVTGPRSGGPNRSTQIGILFTCGEAAGPRKAQVVVVVVVGGPNWVSCVSYSPSLQILFGVGSNPPVYSTKLCHYKFTSGWDPPLSNKISLRGMGSSANISDFLKRSLSPWVYFFLKLYCYSRRSLNKVCSCLVKELFQKTDFAWRPHAFIALGGFKKVIIITRPGLPLCLYTLLQEGT